MQPPRQSPRMPLLGAEPHLSERWEAFHKHPLDQRGCHSILTLIATNRWPVSGSGEGGTLFSASLGEGGRGGSRRLAFVLLFSASGPTDLSLRRESDQSDATPPPPLGTQPCPRGRIHTCTSLSTPTCARTPTRMRTCTRTHAHGQAHARALLAGSLRWRRGTPWQGAEGRAPEKK